VKTRELEKLITKLAAMPKPFGSGWLTEARVFDGACIKQLATALRELIEVRTATTRKQRAEAKLAGWIGGLGDSSLEEFHACREECATAQRDWKALAARIAAEDGESEEES
jgi:hypothetical protein